VSAKGLQECFLNWVRAVHRATEGQIVAIDGKRVRRSFDWGAGKEAIHMVSAWGSANGLVLGQLKTAEKSNKITAIPHLLELLELKGYIVTLDALGCQTEIAEKIIEKGVDYGLAVKRNQDHLYEASSISLIPPKGLISKASPLIIMRKQRVGTDALRCGGIGPL
jgi:hypothetical protein